MDIRFRTGERGEEEAIFQVLEGAFQMEPGGRLSGPSRSRRPSGPVPPPAHGLGAVGVGGRMGTTKARRNAKDSKNKTPGPRGLPFVALFLLRKRQAEQVQTGAASTALLGRIDPEVP